MMSFQIVDLIAISTAGGLIAKSRVESMNRAFREQQSGIGHASGILIGVAVLALAIAGMVFFIYKKRSERTINDSKLLFSELCRAHHLSRSQRRTLKDLAKSKKLADPAVLFLDSSLWIYDPAIPTKRHAKAVSRLLIIQRLLFSPDKTAKSQAMLSATAG